MYQKRTNKNKNEDAVSPVVGVMLMLVVTIVIAAVVAAFATGMVGDQKTAPTVSASVDLNTIEDKVTVTFISVSEPIAKSDLQLNLKSTKAGVLYGQSGVLGSSGAITSGSTVSSELGLEDTSGAKPLDSPVTVKDRTISDTDSMYFTKYAKASTTDPSKLEIVYFDGTTARDSVEENDDEIKAMIKIKNSGTYKYVTCKPGYTIDKKDDFPIMKLDTEELEAGDKVNVEIVHIPSNSIVYAKTITVGA